MDDLDKIKELVLKNVRGVWKNRWIAIAIAWPVMLAGIAAVDQIKDKYTASTAVYIDSSSMLRPLLQGLAIESDHKAVVQLMINKLLSRPNLERVLERVDPNFDTYTPKHIENLINSIRGKILIAAKKRTKTFNISFADENRLYAMKIVQTLLDIFVEDALGTGSEESGSAITFLNKQIEKYDALLREAEKRREEFRRKNVGLMPGDGPNYYTQLQVNEQKLEQAKLSLEESENRREKIKFRLDNLNSAVGADSELEIVVAPSSLDVRINEQEDNLEDLLLQYTEQHPDVINAMYVLESLKKRKQKEIMAISSDPGASVAADTSSPVYQELLVLLTQTEADISTYNTRVKNMEQKRSKLEELVDIVPQIEAEMQRLNRDYSVHQKNYNTLVQRREKARISEDVQLDTKQGKFRVIDPPFAALKPDFPNRGLFDIAVLILAIGIGYGVSMLISLFQPVFYNQNNLSSAFGYPILGTVSKFETAEVIGKRRKNLVLFAAANLLLITVGGVFIVIHTKGHLIFNFANSVAQV